MERKHYDDERLRKIVAAGLLTVAVYELVKYKRSGDGDTLGHVYRLPSKITNKASFIMGAISDGKEGISKLSGDIIGFDPKTGNYDEIELDSSAETLTPEQIKDLESVYPSEDSGNKSD